MAPTGSQRTYTPHALRQIPFRVFRRPSPSSDQLRKFWPASRPQHVTARVQCTRTLSKFSSISAASCPSCSSSSAVSWLSSQTPTFRQSDTVTRNPTTALVLPSGCQRPTGFHGPYVRTRQVLSFHVSGRVTFVLCFLFLFPTHYRSTIPKASSPTGIEQW